MSGILCVPKYLKSLKWFCYLFWEKILKFLLWKFVFIWLLWRSSQFSIRCSYDIDYIKLCIFFILSIFLNFCYRCERNLIICIIFLNLEKPPPTGQYEHLDQTFSVIGHSLQPSEIHEAESSRYLSKLCVPKNLPVIERLLKTFLKHISQHFLIKSYTTIQAERFLT